MNLRKDVVKNNFSTIYVEEDILEHKNTKQILSYFKDSKVIVIHDYRDVFNRKKQNVSIQKQSQNLILAKKKKDYLYEASPVCQSFDNRYFYYSSSMMNCVYDCEYCFLKGMYPSSNIVVFVNLEDFFEECETTLKQHPVYLCVSYDTDMLALEPITHYAKKWSEFAEDKKDLIIEIRTKGTMNSNWKELPVSENVILAFTLSPNYVSNHYEHGAPLLKDRINMINEALNLGYPCRICFDPIILFPNWENEYLEMVKEVKESIDLNLIKDFSIGSFRISKNYLSDMRKQYPNSAVIQYPYVCEDGFYQLPNALREEAENIVLEELREYKDKIFRW